MRDVAVRYGLRPETLSQVLSWRAEDLPWGLIRGGRRTELGDYVLTLVEERDTALRGKHAAEMRRDEAVSAGHTTARLLDDCAATLEAERAQHRAALDSVSAENFEALERLMRERDTALRRVDTVMRTVSALRLAKGLQVETADHALSILEGLCEVVDGRPVAAPDAPVTDSDLIALLAAGPKAYTERKPTGQRLLDEVWRKFALLDQRYYQDMDALRGERDALQARLNALAAPARIDLDELQRQNERWTAALEQGDADAARAAQAYLAGAAAALLRVVVQQGARLEAILAPVEGVDLEEVLRLAATPARSFSAAEDRDATLSYAAPTLAHEVARLRAHQQEAHDRDQRHREEIEALTADLDEAHKMLREGLLAGPLVTGRTEDGLRIRDHLLGWLFTGFAAELERSDAPNNLSFSVTPDEQHPYSGYRMDLSIARPDHPCIHEQNARLREEIEEVRRVLGYFAGDGSEEFIPTTPLGSAVLDLLAAKAAETTSLRAERGALRRQCREAVESLPEDMRQIEQDLRAENARLRLTLAARMNQATEEADEAMRASNAYAEGMADGQALKDDESDEQWSALEAERDAAMAELAELRLILAAERGEPAGAPDPAWRSSEEGWWRSYESGEIAGVFRDGRWYRGLPGQAARVTGRASNQRAGMLAADKALE